MPNSIDFYKRIFLHVIPVRFIVPCLKRMLYRDYKGFDENSFSNDVKSKSDAIKILDYSSFKGTFTYDSRDLHWLDLFLLSKIILSSILEN